MPYSFHFAVEETRRDTELVDTQPGTKPWTSDWTISSHTSSLCVCEVDHRSKSFTPLGYIQEDTWNSGVCFESNMSLRNRGLNYNVNLTVWWGKCRKSAHAFLFIRGFVAYLLGFCLFFFFPCLQTLAEHPGPNLGNPPRGWRPPTDFTLEVLFCRPAVCNSSALPAGC